MLEESGIHYLSPAQLAIVEGEMARVCEALDPTSLQTAAYFVASCLSRARWANSRLPVRR